MHVNQLAQCQPRHGSWPSVNREVIDCALPLTCLSFLTEEPAESFISTYLTALAAMFCAQKPFSKCLHKCHGGILALCSSSSFLITPGASWHSNSSFEQLNSFMSLPSLGHPVSSSHIQILPVPLCPLSQAPHSIFPSTHPSCPIYPFTLSSHGNSSIAGTKPASLGTTNFLYTCHSCYMTKALSSHGPRFLNSGHSLFKDQWGIPTPHGNP